MARDAGFRSQGVRRRRRSRDAGADGTPSGPRRVDAPADGGLAGALAVGLRGRRAWGADFAIVFPVFPDSRAFPVGLPRPAAGARRPVVGVARAGFSLTTGSLGAGRHRMSSLPMCCTGAASSLAQICPSIASRSPRISLNARTLISSCARRLTSISRRTEGVRPCWPIATTGCRWCALARSARRSREVRVSMGEV
jgi:hypothetical protein